MESSHRWPYLSTIPTYNSHLQFTKDFFLRALREVAPEIELFLENHGYWIIH